mmetsp:Transcript_35858/g.54998  ORF Transcript_35858/g.54998 Transcript_35858/m.54998 type:complete len:106 (-) Transcript_35858:379-696(-)
MDANDELGDLLLGFKDGAVNVTGPESLLSYCNGNVSSVTNVYWYKYYNLLKDEVREANFGTYDEFIDNAGNIMDYVEDSFQLPFNVTSNCYWAVRLIYLPIVEQE